MKDNILELAELVKNIGLWLNEEILIFNERAKKLKSFSIYRVKNIY